LFLPENDYLLLKTVSSPDGRENPFVVGFTTKDWKVSRISSLILTKF